MNAHDLGRTLSLWAVVPFVGLLLSIALLPLRAPHFWESHKNKGLVAFLWSLPVAVYFLFQMPHALVLSMKDYASFLLLLTALFIVSGGIVLKGDLKATPEVNTLFLPWAAILTAAWELHKIPAGLDSVADLRFIGDALAARGYSPPEVEAILGGNWLSLLHRLLPET